VVVQEVQKTRVGLAKDLISENLIKIDLVRQGRARNLIPVAMPDKTTLCQKLRILIPHPKNEALLSIGNSPEMEKQERARATAGFKLSSQYQQEGKCWTNFKFRKTSGI
jgi:hypothetical protein